MSAQSTPIALTVNASGTVPPAPTGLNATAVSTSGINLQWTASSGATTYNVLRSVSSGGPYTTVMSGVTGTVYGDTGLAASTTYYYVVQAVNNAGTSSNSNEATATTQSVVTVPAAPTGLTAVAASSSGINLQWTASSGATSYNVLRSTAGGGPYTTVVTGVTGTAYGDTGLTASTTYYYVIQAVNSAGTSSNSSQASATTQSAVTLNLSEYDLGTVSPAGSVSDSNNVYTVTTGSGSDLMVSATADNFSYAAQSMNGDFTITARVATLTCGDTIKCEAAVMIRETLTANSAFAAVGVTTGRGTQLNYRTATGSTSVSTAGAVKSAPYWVRLSRAGNTFTAYTSADGNTWTQLGSPQAITMATSVYFGLALSNHGGTGTAAFDNVGAQ